MIKEAEVAGPGPPNAAFVHAPFSTPHRGFFFFFLSSFSSSHLTRLISTWPLLSLYRRKISVRCCLELLTLSCGLENHFEPGKSLSLPLSLPPHPPPLLPTLRHIPRFDKHYQAIRTTFKAIQDSETTFKFFSITIDLLLFLLCTPTGTCWRASVRSRRILVQGRDDGQT